MKLNEENFFEEVVKPCKKGLTLFLLFSKKSDYVIIKKLFAEFKIPNKRGVWTWKGIVIVSPYFNSEFNKYIDKIIEVT